MIALDPLNDLLLVGFGLDSTPRVFYHPVPTTDGYSRICEWAIHASRRDKDRRRFTVALASPRFLYGWIRPFSHFSDRGGFDFTSGVLEDEDDLVATADDFISDEFEDLHGYSIYEFVERRLQTIRHSGIGVVHRP